MNTNFGQLDDGVRIGFYLAELYARVGDEPAALRSLATASSIELSAEDSESIKVETDYAREVVGGKSR